MIPRAARLALLLITLLTGCSGEDILDPPIPSAEPAVFVVNSKAWTLSRILLADGSVLPNAIALGSVPNAIAIAGGGRRAYVVSSGDNKIDMVDLDALRTLGEIDLGPGSNPWAIALAGGEAYVSCFLSDEVVHVDLESASVIRRIPVGRAPEGLLLAGGFLYVAVTNYQSGFGPGEVAVVEIPADSIRARLIVGLNPQALAPAPDGTVHVVCTGDYLTREGRVFVIDPATPAVVDSLDLGGAPGFVTILADGRGAVAGFYGGLRFYDLRDRTVRPARALPIEGLAAVAFDPVTGFLYVADFAASLVHVVDPEADSLLTAYAVGDGPVDLAIRR